MKASYDDDKKLCTINAGILYFTRTGEERREEWPVINIYMHINFIPGRHYPGIIEVKDEHTLLCLIVSWNGSICSLFSLPIPHRWISVICGDDHSWSPVIFLLLLHPPLPHSLGCGEVNWIGSIEWANRSISAWEMRKYLSEARMYLSCERVTMSMCKVRHVECPWSKWIKYLLWLKEQE